MNITVTLELGKATLDAISGGIVAFLVVATVAVLLWFCRIK